MTNTQRALSARVLAAYRERLKHHDECVGCQVTDDPCDEAARLAAEWRDARNASRMRAELLP